MVDNFTPSMVVGHLVTCIKVRGRTAVRAGETHLEVMCDLNVYLSVTLAYICTYVSTY